MPHLPRITRDPALADFVGLSNRLSRLLNDGLLGAEWQSPDGATTAWVPPVDIFEEDNAIRIMAEIPGVRPEDVKLTVENRSEEHTLNSSHVEISYAVFCLKKKKTQPPHHSYNT